MFSEIGIGLTAVGIFFTILGVALFFDGALLAVGNVSYSSVRLNQDGRLSQHLCLNASFNLWSECSFSTASVPFRSRIDPWIREDKEFVFPTAEAARDSPLFLRNIFGLDEMVCSL